MNTQSGMPYKLQNMSSKCSFEVYNIFPNQTSKDQLTMRKKK